MPRFRRLWRRLRTSPNCTPACWQPQVQLSKEFVREWLMANGFQGKEGQQVPEMTPEYVNSVSERYIELYEKVTGHKFEKAPDSEDLVKRIETNVLNYLNL